MPSAHYDVIRRGGIRFAPDVFGSGTEHSDWHEWCGAQHSVRGSQRVSASAGLTVAVGAATNLCSKIVSPETMMAEQGGPTISRTGRIIPEVNRRSSSEGRTRSERKLSNISDNERR